MPDQSQFSRPSVCIGRPCAEIDCRSIRPTQLCNVIWYSALWFSCGRARGLARGYQAKWRLAFRLAYLLVVYACQQVQILVPLGLWFCDIVSEACHNRSAELFPLYIGLGWKGSCRQLHSTKEHNHCCKEFHVNCSPLLACRYVDI